MIWPILTVHLLLCVEDFLLLPPFPVMPNTALLCVEVENSVRILGEGDRFVASISELYLRAQSLVKAKGLSEQFPDSAMCVRVQSLTLPPSESLVKAVGFLEHFPESLVMCVFSTSTVAR